MNLDVSDGLAKTSTTVFITVITAAQAVNNLADQVRAGNIPAGIQNTLIDDLNAAAASFNRGNFKTGVNQLQTFIADVSSQSGKKIAPAIASGFISAAQAIINAVNAG